jgi:hypothetical protein
VTSKRYALWKRVADCFSGDCGRIDNCARGSAGTRSKGRFWPRRRSVCTSSPKSSVSRAKSYSRSPKNLALVPRAPLRRLRTPRPTGSDAGPTPTVCVARSSPRRPRKRPRRRRRPRPRVRRRRLRSWPSPRSSKHLRRASVASRNQSNQVRRRAKRPRQKSPRCRRRPNQRSFAVVRRSSSRRRRASPHRADRRPFVRRNVRCRVKPVRAVLRPPDLHSVQPDDRSLRPRGDQSVRPADRFRHRPVRAVPWARRVDDHPVPAVRDQ